MTKVIKNANGQAATFKFVLEKLKFEPDDGVDGVLPQTLSPSVTTSSTVTFKTIEFTKQGTYQFRVYEDTTDKNENYKYDETKWTITVVVNEDSNGNLYIDRTTYSDGKNEHNGITFTNTFKATEITLIPSVEKKVTITGEMPGDQHFTFQIEQKNGKSVLDPNPSQKDIYGKGIVNFNSLKFTEPDEYVFEIREIVPDGADSRWSFDETPIIMTVNVTKDDDGALDYTVTYKKNGADSQVFENTFNGGGNPLGEFEGHLEKRITGGTPTQDQQFSFVFQFEKGLSKHPGPVDHAALRREVCRALLRSGAPVRPEPV